MMRPAAINFRVPNHLMEDSASIELFDGQWITRSLAGKHPAVRSLNKLSHQVRTRHTRMQLLFKDEHTIEAFLADTGKNLNPLQSFVRRVHGRAGALVTTAAELENLLHQADPNFRLADGHDWVEQLRSSTFDFPQNLEYSDLIHGSIRSSICLRGAEQRGAYDWHFGRTLNYFDAMRAAARKEPQGLFTEQRAMASWRQELTNLALDVPVWGKVLVVPDDPDAAVMIGTVERGMDTERFGNSATLLPQPVTFYLMDRPVLDMRCCSNRKWEKAERILPLDVMAAGTS